MNKYLIALEVGGTQEIPESHYQNFQIIEAKRREEAVKIYNELNKCTYFYGTCMAEKVGGLLNIINKDITYNQAELLNK